MGILGINLLLLYHFFLLNTRSVARNESIHRFMTEKRNQNKHLCKNIYLPTNDL
jgi:hypothetical protein